MLTRIEIDGFKSFDGFAMDLDPLTVIAGPNAVGKSNLFDVIRLLSRLAKDDLRSAFSDGRGLVDEQFRVDASRERATMMRFAVEVLLNPTVRDPWGETHQLRQTRVRYELVLERREAGKGVERLYVLREEVTPILSRDDRWAAKWRTSASTAFGYGRQVPFLSTSVAGEQPSFDIHQDGHQGRKRPAVAAETTVLSTVTSAEFPHLYALREELRSWRFLQLDPAGLREPADRQAPDRLEASGWNLAAVLARLKAETQTDSEPLGVLGDIAIDLRQIIPNAQGVDVHTEEATKRWAVMLESRGEPAASGRVASDGTLRLLALLCALHDPKFAGVICLEEPENGVQPERLRPLIGVLRDLVSDPSDSTTHEGPLVQLLLTSHSPVVVGLLQDMFSDDVARESRTARREGRYLDLVTRTAPDGRTPSVRTVARELVATTGLLMDPDDVGQTKSIVAAERELARGIVA